MKKRKKNVVLFYLPLVLLVSFVVFPYAWTLLTSLKTTDELYTLNLTFLPNKPTLGNFKTLFLETDFLQSMARSIYTASLTCLIAMLVSSMAGYTFSRYHFKWKNIALSGILLLYMFPSVLYLTPLFKIFKSLNMLGSLSALVVSYCTFTIPFSIWLLTSYMNEIPIELDEAAEIDGASVFQLFVKIIVPMLKPGLVATGSYMFISSWNEYLFAVMFTSSKTRTLPVSLTALIGEYDIRWDIISAGAIMSLVPIVILFLFAQKQLVSGMVAGSVKG
jgi:multiple sugar transport system permease protein